MPVTFTLITPSLQRDSLWRCCLSVDHQTYPHWQHIVVLDGGPVDANLLNSVPHANRVFLCLTHRRHNFGNTPRHLGWKLAEGDYCLYLDDDNALADDRVLGDIAERLEDKPMWAIFPILRHGQWFFSDPPGNCHVDTLNMVIRKDIAQWPDGPQYTMDGLFCDHLKEHHPYRAFPEMRPIGIMETSSKGL